jgi:methylamine dehydrogenase accessory protein MauD
METFLLVSHVVLWLIVLFLGFLLLGTLRALALLSWRLEQWQAITPRRPGREGLKIGQAAPDFALAGADGREVALHDFAGCRVLLVFMQSGCSPCTSILPELNRLQRSGTVQVLAVNNGDANVTRRWVAQAGVCFPVLAQEKFALSKRYQVFATPFAFLIDEKGIIAAKGLAGSRQHLGFVLAGEGAKDGHLEVATEDAESRESP